MSSQSIIFLKVFYSAIQHPLPFGWCKSLASVEHCHEQAVKLFCAKMTQAVVCPAILEHAWGKPFLHQPSSGRSGRWGGLGRGWRLDAAIRPHPNACPRPVRLWFRQHVVVLHLHSMCRSDQPHRSGWYLPWDKEKNVPFPCQDSRLLP